MSKCTICNTRLQLSSRSEKNIDSDRIRAGIMVCWSCQPNVIIPHIPPIRSRSYYVREGLLLSMKDISSLKTKCRRGVRLIKELQRSKDKKEEILKKEALSNKKYMDTQRKSREIKISAWNARVFKLNRALKTYMKRNTCRCCKTKLIVGGNIVIGRIEHSDYICNTCSKLKYWTPSDHPVGRPPLVFDSAEELKDHKRKLKKDERERKKKLYPPGLYGIFYRDKIVYIGESRNMWSRIYSSHFNVYSNYKNKKALKDKSPVCDLIKTKKLNLDEFKWCYLAYENDLQKRLILEDQYVALHIPYLNKPYRGMDKNEYKSLKVYVDERDKGVFDLIPLTGFQPADKTQIKPDGVLIKRIMTYESRSNPSISK